MACNIRRHMTVLKFAAYQAAVPVLANAAFACFLWGISLEVQVLAAFADWCGRDQVGWFLLYLWYLPVMVAITPFWFCWAIVALLHQVKPSWSFGIMVVLWLPVWIVPAVTLLAICMAIGCQVMAFKVVNNGL